MKDPITNSSTKCSNKYHSRYHSRDHHHHHHHGTNKSGAVLSSISFFVCILFALIEQSSSFVLTSGLTTTTKATTTTTNTSTKGFRLEMVASSSSSSSKDHQSEATTTANLESSSSSSSSSSSLQEFDPIVAQLIQQESKRQSYGLELIASENFVSSNVRQVLGSCLTNKYSEGNVGKRYYGGNEYIDQIESVCMERALSLFKLDSDKWGVNVQPYSGSPANFAAYTALLEPHDRIMGLDLPSGGHLTHGFRTAKKKVSATSVYFESLPYVVSPETGYVDYDDMERRANMFLPKLIIAGGSAYPREWDYERMRSIADSVGAYLMVDMAHISGLVAGGVAKDPFQFADLVTSTTHKTLRGPRSGMIFAKRELMDRIDAAVFPSLQGGPHNHQIGALAVALLEASQPEFTEYAKAVVENAQALGKGLTDRGHVLATGGTDNHLLLWDVRPQGLTGSKVDKILEFCSITANKNSVPGDTSAINPGGVRLGTAALTTRGLGVSDFDRVAEFLHRGYELALQAQKIAELEVSAVDGANTNESSTGKKPKVLLKDFMSVVKSNDEVKGGIDQLKQEVEEFASGFRMPGD